MLNSSSYQKLFRAATAEEKLLLFRSLLEAKEELTVDLALALLKIVHEELSAGQMKDRAVYKRYAEEIEALRASSPVALQQVTTNWQLLKTTIPPDWFTYGQG
ncbi:MAG: hypothetical protein IT310_09325 [Anaerolineales bacterium]|nr:hypothetical protein [Anaerolineales bacterium]